MAGSREPGGSRGSARNGSAGCGCGGTTGGGCGKKGGERTKNGGKTGDFEALRMSIL